MKSTGSHRRYDNELAPRVDVDCIITAAGLSSRMGQWKMMLPYKQGTILDASIENARRFCRRLILVAGFRAQELIERYKHDEDITLVVNENYRNGLFSSLQCASAATTADYCFITHGDIPCLNYDVFRQLWLKRGPYTLFPCYQGNSGHPVLVPAARLREAARGEAASMREFLLAGEYRYLNICNKSIVFDVDTPEAYKELIDQYQLKVE